MRWREVTAGYTVATVPVDESVSDALVELCRQIRDGVIPINKEVQWDYLRFELWLDSGRIVVYPALTAAVARVERGACQIEFEAMRDEYDRLAESEMSDEDFSREIARLHTEWVDRISQAIDLAQLSGIAIRVHEADEILPLWKRKL
jgi:hypothetical protein